MLIGNVHMPFYFDFLRLAHHGELFFKYMTMKHFGTVSAVK